MADLVVDPGTVYEVPPEGLTVDNLVVHGELICDGSELVVNNRADIYGTFRVINGGRFTSPYIYGENAILQFLNSELGGWLTGYRKSHFHNSTCEARGCNFYPGLSFTASSNVIIEGNSFFKDSWHENTSCIRGVTRKTFI